MSVANAAITPAWLQSGESEIPYRIGNHGAEHPAVLVSLDTCLRLLAALRPGLVGAVTESRWRSRLHKILDTPGKRVNTDLRSGAQMGIPADPKNGDFSGLH